MLTFSVSSSSLCSSNDKTPSFSTAHDVSEGLRVCHLNVNSVRAHIDRLRHFLSSRPPFHVIAMSETKLSPLIDDDLVSLDGFRLFRRDRNTHGGGVALYINNSFRVKVLAKSKIEWSGKPGFPEYLLCEMALPGLLPIFVAAVYRPPHAPFLAGNDFIPCFLQHLHAYSTKVILGDFNADQLSFNDDPSFLRGFFAENALSLVPHGATHHTPGADTWLDLCLFDVEDTLISYWKTDSPFIDGHDLITATLQVFFPPIAPPRDIEFRNFSILNASAICDHLHAEDWSIFGGSHSVDELVECIDKNLNGSISATIPTRTLKRSDRMPWFTNQMQSLLGERDRLYRVFKRTRSSAALVDYRLARDAAHHVIEGARQAYFQKRLADLHDPASIWRELRHLGVLSSVGGPVDYDAEALNEHFAGVSFCPDEPSVASYLDSLPRPSPEMDVGFVFRPVNADEVVDAVRHFSSEARGFDGIPRSVVMAALPIVTPLLVQVFNESFSSAVFPSGWKNSLIVALNKVKNPLSSNDFRPIALLCFLSKVLERLASLQIHAFLSEHSILDPFQSGFRSGYSTQTALLKLMDDIRIGIDKRQMTMLVLFDFSKAFDTVCHSFLLEKLRVYGFSCSAIRWIASYLVGRSQMTLDGKGGMSTARPLNRGVPQGSVLGPLLFLIYINSISERLPTGVLHLAYADDLQVYLRFPPDELDDALRQMNLAAAAVLAWASQNRLKLNVAKTKAIMCGSIVFVNRVYSLPDIFISVGGVQVLFESSVRTLGVVLDSRLSWKEHVASISQRVHSVMYRLRFFRASTTPRLRKHLVQALVFPILDYCCLVYNGLSDELSLRLQRLVNLGIRYISGAKRDEHVTPYRMELGWLTCEDRRSYFLVVLTYRLLHGDAPGYLRDYLVANESVRPVRGEPVPLVIPRFGTEALRRSFHITASYFWNSLPAAIRNLPSVSSFKSALHRYLFNA